MKFKISRSHFAAGLAQVLNVVGSKGTMPILGNVLIETGEESISLCTTNLDLAVRCSVKASPAKGGAITLPVKRLAQIVRELPSEDVLFEVNAGNVKLTSGGSAFKILGIDANDFPRPWATEDKDPKTYTLKQDDLASMIRSVSFAQSTDETRYILNGTFFKIDAGKLSVVATDGRRLALITCPVPDSNEQKGAFILPARAVAEVSRLISMGEVVKLAHSDRRAVFHFATDKDDSGLVGEVMLYSKIVEGNYPNYQQVVPKETFQRIKLERELFLQCVHRAALVCSEKANTVTLKLSANLLDITAQSPDFGTAHETMLIGYDGPGIEIAFNPGFLADPLRALPKDEVFLEVKDAVSPGVIKTSESYVCVIMPVRVS